jgi:tetratricopeptide (TPR) repeat protein
LAADRLLEGAQQSDAAGIALAWRAFVRLTEHLEFRQDDPGLAEQAVAMAEEATRLSPRNAIVWALASQISIYLTGDYDVGMYYARRAADCADDDPYTLDALSAAAAVTLDRTRAFELAERGRKAADGLDNVYNWDMQCCISAMYVDRLEAARDYAQDCHWKMPHYRPALRYLTALHLLTGDRESADKYADRLKKLEPDFELPMLCGEDYPVMTLRNLGVVPQIRSALAA